MGLIGDMGGMGDVGLMGAILPILPILPITTVITVLSLPFFPSAIHLFLDAAILDEILLLPLYQPTNQNITLVD